MNIERASSTSSLDEDVQEVTTVTHDTLEDFIRNVSTDILPKEFKEQWLSRLDDTDDREEELHRFHADLDDFISKRKGLVLPDPELSGYSETHPEVLEEVREYIEHMREMSLTPEREIGGGRYGRVSEDHRNSKICIKRIHNYLEYAKGENNSVRDEMSFLDKLSDLEIDATRTPHPFGLIDGVSFQAVVMERINGWSISDFKKGEVILPDIEGFQVERFISRVGTYLRAMHERGIYHRDLFSRNIMIDADHRPYIIDFGNAAYIDPNDHSEDAERHKEGYKALDFSRLTRVKKDLEDIIEKERGKRGY
jgi:predicted Ser/Thr protein kinase